MSSPDPAFEVLATHLSSKLDTYLASFNASDFPATASHYHAPSTIISPDGVVVLQTHADVILILDATLTRLKKEGFMRSEWAGKKSFNVLELVGFEHSGNHGRGEGLGDRADKVKKGLVMVSSPFQRLRGDGSVIEEFTGTYVLRFVCDDGKEGGEWKIVSALQHNVARPLI